MSCVASWRANDVLASRRSVPSTRDRPRVASERGRLGVEHVALVRLRGQVDGGAEAGPALAAAGQSELAGDRRTGVLDVDRDGHPRPDPGVALEERVRRPSSGPSAAAGAARAARGGGDQPDGDERRATARADWARGARGDGANRWHVAHRRSGPESRTGRPARSESCRPTRLDAAAIVRCWGPGS